MKNKFVVIALSVLGIGMLISLTSNYNKGAAIGGAKLPIKDPDDKK